MQEPLPEEPTGKKDKAALGRLEYERKKVERAEVKANMQPLINGFEACKARRSERAANRKLDANEQGSEDSDCILLTAIAHRANEEQQQQVQQEQRQQQQQDEQQQSEDDIVAQQRKEEEEAAQQRREEIAAQQKTVDEMARNDKTSLEDEDGDAIPPILGNATDKQSPHCTGK